LQPKAAEERTFIHEISSRVLNHPPGQRDQRGGSSGLPFGPVVAGFSISGQPGD